MKNIVDEMAADLMFSMLIKMLTDNTDPDLLRVCVNDADKFDIVDFTTPAKDGKFLWRNAPQESVPVWIIEAISMLRITEPRSVVRNVGFKLTDKLYYIVDKRGDHETN